MKASCAAYQSAPVYGPTQRQENNFASALFNPLYRLTAMIVASAVGYSFIVPDVAAA